MAKQHIEIGDAVTVCFTDGSTMDGVVNYMPSAPGDCWVIETGTAIYHVQRFDTICKKR